MVPGASIYGFLPGQGPSLRKDINILFIFATMTVLIHGT